MKKWREFADKIKEMERKELSNYTITQHKMYQASYEAQLLLEAVPNATRKMIKKIMNFTIVVPRNPPGLIDCQELYKAYLPHLQREIGRAALIRLSSSP